MLGAEILGKEGLVGAPHERRLALASLSLLAAGSPVMSAKLAASLAGCWTSVFMFRRSLMVVLHELYAVAHGDMNAVYNLPRMAADELVLASLLSPLAVPDLRAKVPTTVWAMDASPSAGAFVSTKVSKATARTLWRHHTRGGGYSRLEARPRAYLRETGDLDADMEVDCFPISGSSLSVPSARGGLQV
jgi:hypothetical protein